MFIQFRDEMRVLCLLRFNGGKKNVYPRESSEVLSGDAAENKMHRRKGDVITTILGFRLESHQKCGNSVTLLYHMQGENGAQESVIIF